ncbi:MAG: 50S ribosomal protein L17 [Deltaproteobacteria bacterium]|nr:50S ribosomal protein L17 [Deltaproteobacteria bacterium]
MRHQHGHRKLGRSVAHRRALLRNLATSFVLHDKCRTTLPKAKELRPIIEKFITLARKDSLHGRRQAYSYFFDKQAVHKLFAEIAPRYKDRTGGYTRILKTDPRPGDAAPMAVIEFVSAEVEAKPKKKTAKKSSAKKSAAPKADDTAVEKKASAKKKSAAKKKATETKEVESETKEDKSEE